MNTLFLFALSSVTHNYYLAAMVPFAPVSLIVYLTYSDWKPRYDLQRAETAAKRLRQTSAPAIGHVTVDCIREVKTLLRYCRAYGADLAQFGFMNEDILIDHACAVSDLQEGRCCKTEWNSIRSNLAPYFLKHV